MMPIAAIAVCLLVSRVAGVNRIEQEVLLGEHMFRRKKVFNAMIRFLCPFFAAIILISLRLETLAIHKVFLRVSTLDLTKNLSPNRAGLP